MSEISLPVWVIIIVTLIATMFWGLLSLGPDTEHTCPNYGEVPALIDGGYECIEWEVQP